MRAVVQRVLHAQVEAEEEIIGKIEAGMVVFIGFSSEDDEGIMEYMLDKIFNLRIFEDGEGKMNLSVLDIKGEILFVPNFTLYGDCRKGRRPSYISAAKPSEARDMYEIFVKMAESKKIPIQTGEFQAEMKVDVTNDGPITLLIDSDKQF